MATTQGPDQPAGRARLQSLHTTLVKDGYDIPADYQLFEEKILEKPERLQSLHTKLVADKYDIPADYSLFEGKATEGLKKKDLSGAPAGTGSYLDEVPFSDEPALAVAGGLDMQQRGDTTALPAGMAPPDITLPPSGSAEQVAQPTLSDDRFDAVARSVGEGAGIAEPTYLQVEKPPVAAPAEEDGFWATFGKSLQNSLNPRRLVGNVVDYLGDAAEMVNPFGTRMQIPGLGLNDVTSEKGTDKFGDLNRQLADRDKLPVSERATQSVLDEPLNPAAWGNLLGQGAGSIVQVGGASLVGGPAAAAAVGAGLSVSSTKDAAREAGISEKEATITATVLAPVVGALESLGMGFITKNPAATKLLQAEIVRRAVAYGSGKLTKNTVVKAASEVLPEMVKRVAGRAATGAVGEAGTEFLQGVAEGEGQVLADALRDESGPSYGTTQADVFKQAAEGAVAGALLGGAGGGVAGIPNVQQSEATAQIQSEATAAPTPQFEVPQDVAPEEAQKAQQAFPQPVQIVRPTGQVMFPNAQVVGISADNTMARVVGEDIQGNPVDTTVPVEYISEQPITETTTDELNSGPATLPAESVPASTTVDEAPVGEQPAGVEQSSMEAAVLPEPSVVQSAPVLEQDATQNAAQENLVGNSTAASTPIETILTPQQKRVNGVLDEVDAYRALTPREQKSAKGQAFRATLVKLAKEAALDLQIGNDFSVKVTRDGKRVTRVSAVTATSEVENFIPARNRVPQVRDAALTVAQRAATGPGEIVALGITINGKRLNASAAAATAKDILEGRNTVRANELLTKMEQAVETGFIEMSTGTGLATEKVNIPLEDFLGNPDPSTIQSKQPADLSDSEIDALIAEDSSVKTALADYVSSSGAINYTRMATTFTDPAGYSFVFGVDEATAVKLKALVDERASQPAPAASTQPTPDARTAAPGLSGPASPDSGSQAEEVADKRTAIQLKRQAIAERIRHKSAGRLNALPVDLIPDYVEYLTTYVEEGVVLASDLVQRLRTDLGDTIPLSATEDELRGLAMAAGGRPDAPALAPRTDTGGWVATEGERRTVVGQLNNPTLSEQRQARLEREILSYTPRPVSQAEEVADAAILGKSLAEAYSIVLDADNKLPSDARLLARERVSNELDRLGVEADAAGNEALADQYMQMAFAIDLTKAEENTEAGRLINANRALVRYSPRAVVYQARKEVARQQKAVKARVRSAGRAVAGKVREVQAEVVDSLLQSKVVEAAKQQLTGEAIPAAKPDATTYGSKNKLVTREKYDEQRRAFRNVAFSTPVPPQLIVGAIFHLEAGTRAFADVAAKLVRDFGVRARPYLADAYQEASQQFVAKGGNPNGLTPQAAVVQATAQQSATATVRAGIKDLGKSLDQIAREHVSQQQDDGETLIQKFVAQAGLTQQEAAIYADTLEKEFAKQVAARQESILNRLYSLRARIKMGRQGKTVLDKALTLLNLSPVSESRVIGLLSEATTLPELSVQQVSELRKLATTVEQAKEGRDKEKAVRELSLYLEGVKGISKLDLAQALWYANVLSSYATHAVNFVANTYQTTMEALIATGSVAVQGGNAAAPVRGLAKGLKVGASLAREVLTTGYEPSMAVGKYEIPNTLEVAAREGNKLAGVLKFVPRLLKAGDIFFQTGLREMRAWELATVEAAKDSRSTPTRAHWELVYEKLGNNTQRWADAQATAAAEGRVGRDAALRTWELMEQSRPMQMQEDYRAYAQRAVFNGEMEGTLGVFFTAVTGAIENMGRVKPLGKWVVPFSKVITNVANTYGDYTLHGFVRWFKGGIGFEGQGQHYRPYTTEERSKVFAKAMLGTTLLAALYAATHREDEEDNLQISGPGPRDVAQRNQLLQNGWRPYAVKVGETWVSYKESPLFFVLGAMGALKDRELYEKANPEKDDAYLSGASLLLMRTLAMVVETTATKNLSDALDALTSSNGNEELPGQKLGRYLERTLGYSVTGYIPAAGLLRQFSRDVQDFTDADKMEAKGAWEAVQQDVPVFRSGLRPALDALGQPMKVQSDRLLSGKATHRDAATQALWDVLTEKGVGIPVPNQRTTTAFNFQEEGDGQLPGNPANPRHWKEGPMSDETFYKFLQLRGEIMRSILVPNAATFKDLTRKQAKDTMTKISQRATNLAKQRLHGAKQKDGDIIVFKEFL